MTSTHSTKALDLPLLQPAQTLKYLTQNDALLKLDALTQMRVRFPDPADPAQLAEAAGQLYWTGDMPLGAWEKNPNQLAQNFEGTWRFISAQRGFLCVVPDTQELRVFDGADWVELAGQGGKIPERLSRLGIGTDPQDDQPFVVRGAGSLLTHAGTDHRLTINRASASDTASLLFQTDYRGSAEIGLSGKKLAFRSSADGESFRDVLSFEPQSGNLSVAASGAPAEMTVHGGLALRRTNTGQPSTPTVFDITASGTEGAPYTLTRFFSYSPSGWQGNYFMAYRARGTEAAPESVQAGDLIYAVDSNAHDGTTSALAARIAFYAAGDPASGQLGGHVLLSLADAAGQMAGRGETIALDIGPNRVVKMPGGAAMGEALLLASKTATTRPSASPAGQMIFVSEAGVPAYSDGTVWRSLIDGAVV